MLCGLAGIAGLVSAQTNDAQDARHLLHRHGRRTVHVVRQPHRRIAARRHRQRRRPRSRAHRRGHQRRGVTQIDHMWTTHYHGDHVGAMEELAKRVPIRHFYDHGPIAPNDRATPPTFLADVRDAQQGSRARRSNPATRCRWPASTSSPCRRMPWRSRRTCPAEASRIPRAPASRRKTSAPTSIPTTDRRRGSS